MLRILMVVTGAVALTAGLTAPAGLDATTRAAESAPSLTATFEKLYWTNHRMSRIERADPDGTNRETVVSAGIIAPWGIAIDATSGKIYWTDPWANRIQRANLDGSGMENLVTVGLDRPGGLALDPVRGKMYWTEERAAEICRSNLDGSEVEVIVSGLGRPTGIALDPGNGHIYWGDHGTDTICRADLDGSHRAVLVSGLPLPVGIALDLAGGKMYWAEGHLDRIQRADLDGSDVEDLVPTGQADASYSMVQSVALDLQAGVMYWTDAGDGCQHIRRARLDGTGVETIVTTGLDHPLGLAILPSLSSRPPPADRRWDFVSRALAGVDRIVVPPHGGGKLVLSDGSEVGLEVRKKVEGEIATWTLKSGKTPLGTLVVRLAVREATGEVLGSRIVLRNGTLPAE